MSKLWKFILFHGWMSYLMTAGLLLFTSGFLLNRISRPEQNECVHCSSKEANCIIKDMLQNLEKIDSSICLEKKARVVLLVVDALKYEFADWHNDDVSDSTYHRNKIPIVHQTLLKYPNHSRLYKFMADPPTTTLQRLKGLVTGSLPTFIDISSNFGSENIDEDNVVDQNSNAGVVFMGDDTWINLFPGKFKRQFPSPSFNVWDLDSVDRDVRYRIFFELKKKDWSLLVAHILGIDHCGHKHGSRHPEMTRKLNDTNTLIAEIMESLEDDMMLFVIGDHGMTITGDHGGDSDDELEAALFIYSKLPLYTKEAVKSRDQVNQIDIVPTLAAILGSAIPFSNIGTLILDALPNKTEKNGVNEILWDPLFSLWMNIAQTKKYIDTYSSDTDTFSKEQLEQLEIKFNSLSKKVKSVDSIKNFQLFIEDAKDYFKLLKDTCMEVWVQFDSGLMSKGLILMFCTLFFFYLFVTGIPEDRMSTIFKSSFLKCSIVTNAFTILMIFCLHALHIIQEWRNPMFFATGAASILLLVVLIVQNWDVISMSWYNLYEIRKTSYIARIILLLTICGLFSNSYIVEEDNVMSFLLVTLICLLVFHAQKDDSLENTEKRFRPNQKPVKPTSLKPIIIAIGLIGCASVRLSCYFWRCREEQRERICSSFVAGKTGSIISHGLDRILLIVALIALALYITIMRLWLRTCGNLSGFSPSAILGRYCPVVIGVCIGCYWVLQRLPKLTKAKFVLSWQVNALPNTVYILSTIAIFILYYRPLCVFLLPRKKTSIDIFGTGENLVPRLFEKIKDSMYRKKDTEIDETPIIYGLGTVYSAAFISLSIFLVLLYSLLLGDVLSTSTFLLITTCTCVLSLSALERCKNATSIAELVDVPTRVLVAWFLIAEYFFYGTGHQMSFPTIHWDAAFIGTGGNFQTNIIPAILIGINTFGSHIILGISVPLLVIAPFTLYLILPKMARIKFFEDNLKRGELALFERNDTFHAAIFSVSAKYIQLHGIRTFASMLAATIHCRHLMVWKIFAPKLIFQGLGFLVSTTSVMLSFFLVFRIDQQVERLIASITKNR
ncbi:GPI ethanolamine phosphate transferase 3 [Prorops nasuta]|uniref:GPI ethanolamine phosphate transferase 3 n=1 Tax=Prorops nasuta TaxID=863751 RepID=UPI0034CD7D74